MSNSVSEQNTLEQIFADLEFEFELEYPDEDTSFELIRKAVRKWILQYIKAYVKGTVYDREIGALNELLEDLDK